MVCQAYPGTDGLGKFSNCIAVIDKNCLNGTIKCPHSESPNLLTVLQHVPTLEVVVLQSPPHLQPPSFGGILVWFEQSTLRGLALHCIWYSFTNQTTCIKHHHRFLKLHCLDVICFGDVNL